MFQYSSKYHFKFYVCFLDNFYYILCVCEYVYAHACGAR